MTRRDPAHARDSLDRFDQPGGPALSQLLLSHQVQGVGRRGPGAYRDSGRDRQVLSEQRPDHHLESPFRDRLPHDDVQGVVSAGEFDPNFEGHGRVGRPAESPLPVGSTLTGMFQDRDLGPCHRGPVGEEKSSLQGPQGRA